jgi:NAD(P)-dependent dehydrogenase (short-subunit alcohol dehydrogenase family)
VRFSEKIVLVTGASRGLGRALALALAREGAAVVCTARTLDGPPERGSLNGTVHHIESEGGRAMAVACDVGDPASVEATVGQALAHFGRVDILVNNAGVFPDMHIAATEPGEWDATVAVNFTGPFLFCRYLLPGMIERRGGAILNMTSGMANLARPGRVAYSATKAALDRFTINLAEEVRPHGIAVNALGPGVMATEMTGGDGDPPELAAPAALWLLEQGVEEFTGQVVYRKGFGKTWGN